MEYRPSPNTVERQRLPLVAPTVGESRRDDVLAYSAIGSSNGPVEAISDRLEHLRGIVLRFRNLDHYILRSLIHSGGLQAKINAVENRRVH